MIKTVFELENQKVVLTTVPNPLKKGIMIEVFVGNQRTEMEFEPFPEGIDPLEFEKSIHQDARTSGDNGKFNKYQSTRF